MPIDRQGFRRFLAARLVGLAPVLAVFPLFAATPVVEIEIRDHLFYPSEVVIPADTKVKLLVKNLDPTPEEFESYELNREKVIAWRRASTRFSGNSIRRPLRARSLSNSGCMG